MFHSLIDFSEENNWLYVLIVYPLVLALLCLFPILDYFGLYNFAEYFLGIFNNMGFIESIVKGIFYWGIVIAAGVILAILIYIGTFARERGEFHFRDCWIDIFNIVIMGSFIAGTITMICLAKLKDYEPIDVRIFYFICIFEGCLVPCLVYSLYRIFACTPFLKTLIRPLLVLIDLISGSFDKGFDYSSSGTHKEIRDDADYDLESYEYTTTRTESRSETSYHDAFVKDEYTNARRIRVEVKSNYEVPVTETHTGVRRKNYHQKREYTIEEGEKTSKRTGNTYSYSRVLKRKNVGKKRYDD